MTKEESAIEKMIKWLEKENWFMGAGYKNIAIKKAKELLEEQNKKALQDYKK